MRILAIETSCDETAVAILSGEGDVLTVHENAIASQAAEHAKYGGVVPEVAARRHVDALFPLLEAAGVPRGGEGIDAIAVTAGPGLVPALRIGVEAAKTLAYLWKKPLVPVNHLEGHLYSAWLEQKPPMFPALTLLVSGGHTELILMKDHGVYELLGKTRDDAAGECFDKAAKLMGLSYPGGPNVSKLAQKGNAKAIEFTRPMLESGDLDFSFSGLKTAVAVYLAAHPEAKPEDVCASFEEAVVDVLVQKTMMAAEQVQPASIILCGGVSANGVLRERLRETIARGFPDTTFHVPDMAYTGDNAAMIGAAGYFGFRAGKTTDPLTLTADPNMKLAERV